MTPTNQSFAFLQSLGPLEIFVVVFLILLLFGAKKLPELARGMGKAMKEFKKATKDVEEDIRTAMEEEPEVEVKKEPKPVKTQPTSPESDN
ncbi:MAG: twin-arginine translocase TatA/TatE family subunit [Verrucomicrobia bacterium]|nr:twin-arginine translocase TatA/TatE family subunit [Verrucomicrobiota bacterium]